MAARETAKRDRSRPSEEPGRRMARTTMSRGQAVRFGPEERAAVEAVPLQYQKQLPMSLPHATVVPMAPRSVREKRPTVTIPVDDSLFRNNYSAATGTGVVRRRNRCGQRWVPQTDRDAGVL
ncbi:hypothetical protein Syun_014578 [Stephania yunnanensis]|uniref:Uncharacterized protein n=1 Tax=Stephania yunnanensis TaxID=152371 RepID=A0AAP0P8P7_9MAGN